MKSTVRPLFDFAPVYAIIFNISEQLVIALFALLSCARHGPKERFPMDLFSDYERLPQFSTNLSSEQQAKRQVLAHNISMIDSQLSVVQHGALLIVQFRRDGIKSEVNELLRLIVEQVGLLEGSVVQLVDDGIEVRMGISVEPVLPDQWMS